MTRENKLAAQSAACRAASLLTGALLLVGLAGCGGSLFQISDTADASLAQKAKPAVALSPVQGVPDKYASKVNDQLAAAIKAKGVTIVEAKDARYIIKAAYSARPDAKHGTKVAYNIDVTDKAGNKIRSLAGEELVSAKQGGDAWGHVTAEGIQKAAGKSAVELTAWIDNPNAAAPGPAMASAAPAPAKVAANAPARPAPAKPAAEQTPSMAVAVQAPSPAAAKHKPAAAPAEIAVIVPVVTGAPGDGKTALAEAMKRALAQQGVKVATAARPGAYKIQGSVELGAAANGQQPITIRWVVLDPAGKQMEKTVVQNNKVGAGSLDGTWGEIADQAAAAAASEVSKLLQKPAQGQAQQGTNGSAG